MTYDFRSLSDMLESPLFLEGEWSEIPLKKCQKVGCPHCNNVVGFAFVSCLICRKNISQCNLITLHGICRVREDHMCGYPAAHVCMECFPMLNDIITDIRCSALPILIHDPLKSWMLDHWNFFQ